MKAVLPDGTELNFPDGTDPGVVQATVKRVIQTRQAGSGGANAASAGGSPTLPPHSLSDLISPRQATQGGLLDDSSDVWERMKNGLATGTIKSALGLKQLVTSLSPENEDVLAQIKQDEAKQGTAGHLAGIGGDVAGGVAATIVAPELTLPSYLGRAAPLLKAALGSGAQAFATGQGDYTDKALEAGKAALVGAGTMGAGQLVKKGATRMFNATQDAIDLFNQGISPTLQQAAESRAGKFIGGLTSGFSHVRNRQEQEVADALTDRISAGGVSMPGATMNQRVGALDAGINNDYNAVSAGKLFPMTNTIRNAARTETQRIGGRGQFPEETAAATGALDNILGTQTAATRLRPDNFRENYLDPLQFQISDASNPKVKDALVRAKNVITEMSRNSQMTPDELDALSRIDPRYFDLMRLRDATKGAAGQETGVDVNKLANAYGRGPGMENVGAHNATNEELVGPLVRTLGSNPRQDEARTALVNAMRIGGAVGATTVAPWASVPLYGLSALGQTGAGARALTGNTNFQRTLREALDSPQTGGWDPRNLDPADLLRVLRDNSTSIGAGLTGN